MRFVSFDLEGKLVCVVRGVLTIVSGSYVQALKYHSIEKFAITTDNFFILVKLLISILYL